MSAFYDRLAATSLRLLTKFGQPVTLQIHSPGTYYPGTGEATPVASESTRVCVIFDDDKASRNDPDSLLKEQGKKAIMDADGVAPELNATIILATGEAYTISKIDAIAPAGAPVVYQLQLRA